jgi:hypothetical protein
METSQRKSEIKTLPYRFTTSGVCTFSEFEIFTGAAFVIWRLTLLMVNLARIR